MIHAATLLHDDVIDDGCRRRYHATANNLWGANFAVLLGDYLLSRAFVAAASAQRDDINRILSETASIICRGEMLQNAWRGDFSLTDKQYIDIIEKKTAVFFANCALLGGIISGMDKNTCSRLYDFGLNLGLAFQIIDDLVDIVGTETQTGKTIGRDFGSKTLTLPAIFALTKLAEAKKIELLELFSTEKPDMSRIVSILDSVKGIDYAKSQAIQFRQKALASLDGFGSCPAASALKELTLSATQIPL
jgi:octaprenyl-diphosphate synthase